MKRLGIALLVLLVALAAFWIGLMVNFPGESVARYVESQVNSRQAFELALTPAELRWNRLHVDKAELRRRDNLSAEPLFTVTDFDVPITWRLLRGLSVRAAIGREGELAVFLPWGVGGEARLDGRVNLGEVPLPAVVRPLAVAGRLELHGRFAMDAEAQAGARLPEGSLEGTGQELVVSGAKFGATDLPAARLESIDVTLDTGRTVNLRRFDYRGDLQGTIAGTVTPNLRDPRNSLLALRITTAFRDTWVLQLGDLRPVLEGLLNRGRLELNLTGTVGNPQLVQVGAP